MPGHTDATMLLFSQHFGIISLQLLFATHNFPIRSYDVRMLSERHGEIDLRVPMFRRISHKMNRFHAVEYPELIFCSLWYRIFPGRLTSPNITAWLFCMSLIFSVMKQLGIEGHLFFLKCWITGFINVWAAYIRIVKFLLDTIVFLLLNMLVFRNLLLCKHINPEY